MADTPATPTAVPAPTVAIIFNHVGVDEYVALKQVDPASLDFTPEYPIEMVQGLKQGPAQEEFRPEKLGLGWALAARLEQPDVKHLAGVVPIVDGVMDIQPLVALEADQCRAEQVRHRLGHLRLSHAGFPFEKDGARQLLAEVEGCRQAAIRDVPTLSELILEGIY